MTNNAQSAPFMLLLNASPRPAGRVSRWLAAIESAARADGFRTETLRVADLSVQPCRGCMACRQSGRCVLPADDAQRTQAILKEADALVVGTPCYWGNVPGQLKVLFDRMVYGMMGESRRAVPVPLMQGKRAAVIATCSTPWPFNRWFRQSSGAVRALREVFRWSGIRLVATVERGGRQPARPLSSREEARCRRVVRKLHPHR